jgi:acetyltransferase-like isoleucine patch superfamily enzyme
MIFMLNVMLIKARLQTPWAGLFSSVLVNLFPLRHLYPRIFGPHTRSNSMGDVYLALDPYYLEVGEQVTIGFHATILCHYFDRRGLYIKRVKIGDGAVVGGESTLMPGVEVGHHAVIGSRSLVMPNTMIGPYEFWAGTPARKIRDLAPESTLQKAVDEATV